MEKVGCLDCTRENLNRRAFLRVGSLTFLGIGLRQYLEASSLMAASNAKAKACILLWLEVDTLIREKTKGQRSLDDFCRRFYGGKDGAPSLKPFTLDDLAADLNAIAPHDWKGMLTKRVTATAGAAPLEGIRRGGWKLAYAAKPSDLHTTRESEDKIIDLTASVGMRGGG